MDSTACQIFDVRAIFFYAGENGFLKGKKIEEARNKIKSKKEEDGINF